MDSPYPTAPELPEKPAKVPQLVRDGKASQTEATETEPITDTEVDEAPDELNEHVEDPGDPDGVIAAEERQKWAEQHPVPPEAPRPPRRRWPWVVVVVILVLAVAFIAYEIGSRNTATPASQAPATRAGGTSGTAKTPPQTAPTQTKHYDSTLHTLSFDYPETWTVADTADKLTVTSPALKLAAATGSQASAHVVVTIQNQQASIPGYPTDGATAVLASDKLTYTQPTAVQRAQTYLSYLSFSGSGLNALYITGDSGYQRGQNVPLSDVVKGNPLVSVMFENCADTSCQAAPTTVSLNAAGWQGSVTSTDVINLLQSMQFN